MENNKPNGSGCAYKQGSLPSCAPLAAAYVPMQTSSEPAYSSGEALSRGTLFPGLDLPFQNIVNKMPADSTPLRELMALNFVLQELALYLDTHQSDSAAFATYKSFLQLYNDGRSKYVELYGPITRSDLALSASYDWLKGPWPWEYVNGSTEG